MTLTYTVSKEKGSSRWFCHQVGSKIPVPGSYGDKKKALHIAAEMNGLPFKQYLKERKKEGGD